jgi:endonuclease III
LRRRSSTRKSRRSTAGPEPRPRGPEQGLRGPGRAARLPGLVARLRAFYGALPAPPPLPFAAYAWEVLSVASHPARRDAAFNALKRIPALTADAVARAPQATLEAAVALAGPRKDERIRALRAGAALFKRNPSLEGELQGPFRRALRAARSLPHIGRASSLRILLFAGGHPVLPLDEEALRVAQRLGYGAEGAAPLRAISLARQALLAESGRGVEAVRAVSQYLTHHGVATCTESAPHCGVCPLAPDCRWLQRQ